MADSVDGVPAPADPVVTAEKRALRAQLLVRRGERISAERAAAAAANGAHLFEALAQVPAVCAYLPLASEPLTTALLDRLADQGQRVLVPVVTGTMPLDWVDYSAARRAGEVAVAGPLGIAELGGPRLGPAVAAEVPALLVPALAIDRNGYRLGRGGGHYDRTLALVHQLGGRPTLIGVLFDDELLPFVPHDELDVLVTRHVTPSGGVQIVV